MARYASSLAAVYASLYALPRMHTCTTELNRTRDTVRSWRAPSVLRAYSERTPVVEGAAVQGAAQYWRSTSGGRIGASEPAPPAQPSRTWRFTREFHPRATRSAPVMLGLAHILSLRLVAARRCAAHGPMLPTGPSAHHVPLADDTLTISNDRCCQCIRNTDSDHGSVARQCKGQLRNAMPGAKAAVCSWGSQGQSWSKQP